MLYLVKLFALNYKRLSYVEQPAGIGNPLHDTLTRSDICFAECKELHFKFGLSALIKL